MLKSARAKDGGVSGCSFDGCSCHNKKRERRKGKHAARQDEKRQWRREEGLQ
jgi:hypothetical protein